MVDDLNAGNNHNNDQTKKTPPVGAGGSQKDLGEDLMPQMIRVPAGPCLPNGRHAQRIREQAELAAIASGFTNPERAGELAVRRAVHLVEVQR